MNYLYIRTVHQLLYKLATGWPAGLRCLAEFCFFAACSDRPRSSSSFLPTLVLGDHREVSRSGWIREKKLFLSRFEIWHYYCYIIIIIIIIIVCGLVVRVSGYRSRGRGFDSRRFQIFWKAAGLERGPLSLVRITEELPGKKRSGLGLENRD
jgi:hypothetical protein